MCVACDDDDDDADAPDDEAGTIPCMATRGRVLGTTTGRKPGFRFFILTAPGARPQLYVYQGLLNPETYERIDDTHPTRRTRSNEH